MGRGNPFSVLFGLFAMLIIGCLYAIWRILVAALWLVLLVFVTIRAVYRHFRKSHEQTFDINRAPRPVMTNGLKAKPGPRDWTPKGE